MHLLHSKRRKAEPVLCKSAILSSTTCVPPLHCSEFPSLCNRPYLSDINMEAFSEDISETSHAHIPYGDDERVYFVPYRWWKEAQHAAMGDWEAKRGLLYLASPMSSYAGPLKIINNIFSSDLVFNLRREEDPVKNREDSEVGVSGRDFALVPGEMWLQALKWHSDSKIAPKNGRRFLAAEDDMSDVYPLKLRLSVMRETNSLGVKICKKDNAAELFKRACKIFTVDSELLCIWDFSGQTTMFLADDRSKLPKDCQRQSDQEVLLELQVYGISDSIKFKEGKREDVAAQSLNTSGFFVGASATINGNSGNTDSYLPGTNFSNLCGSSGEAGSLGLTGLQNLGNTCFMNSAIQCLAHTAKLVDYFLGDYNREINHDNPLGMDGELAQAFGDLLRKLWALGATPVAPRVFKSKLARFAPQFSGFNQHDSQELLAFLLDGLHEDLNRVKCKPYLEAKDANDRPDEEVADEYWRNHLARNNSIIVDVCQGQYKSRLVCPECKKISITFDPFMYLSLPLPSTMLRTMTLTVMTTDGSTLPVPLTVTVPKYGKLADLIEALRVACSLEAKETLLVAEIYNNRIIRFLEEPADSLSLIRDDDRLVVYRVPKNLEGLLLVVFMHQHLEEQYIHGKLASGWKAFGIPLVAKFGDDATGFDIHKAYTKLLNPFWNPVRDALNNHATSETATTEAEEVVKMDDLETTALVEDGKPDDQGGVDSTFDSGLEFFLTDEKGIVKDAKIVIDEPVSMTGMQKRLSVLVRWPEKLFEHIDLQHFGRLPEISRSRFFANRPQESVSLYKCLEAFLMEEPLGPEDMWYCPGCKKHRQASKKLDLWRLPEILVIHLKRFSYSRYTKTKLETYVDFPLDNLDLSSYITHKNGLSQQYTLYAISNHYGSMGGGHYTAFLHHGGNRWYEFDDSHVHPISEDKIKSSAAYVLFYRRVAAV